MGKLLDLKRLMSVPKERNRRRRQRQIRARNGSIDSVAKRKGSLCQQVANSDGERRTRYSGPNLPEDIWCHIHSLMPFKDAARAACVSRAFRRSWQHRPNLIFCIGTLGLDFINKIDRIIKNHSGIGIKSLQLEYDTFCNARRSASISYHLNNWLQIAVTPWIEELILTLSLSSYNVDYNFPCSLLSDGRGSSLRHLYLGSCFFHPTVNLELRNLTRLHLVTVHITGDEFGCLLSNSYALERLELKYCYGIICLKIPCLLQRLSHLEVRLLLGESLQMKTLSLDYPSAVYYARAELPSNVPNLEILTICSDHEMVDTPMLPSKFFYLKCLTIDLAWRLSPAYDYFSLISFLDASPSLETFCLEISQDRMENELIIGDMSHMRQMLEHRHDNLQSVEIIGFCYTKSLIELTCHILDNTTSLKHLKLDTTRDVFSCSTGKHDKCFPMGKDMLTEAKKAVLAIETYIEPKVPSTVMLNVVKPCNRCHVAES
uniref:F-box domain-containing protein n=1 Tax=Oryza nivara TaxID=4536 RepID=A0A0E0GIE9_ORYNI